MQSCPEEQEQLLMDTLRLSDHDCCLLGELQGFWNPSHVSNGLFGGYSYQMFMKNLSLIFIIVLVGSREMFGD